MAKDIRRDFDSMGDFLQWLDDTPPQWVTSESKGETPTYTKFSGTRNMGEANRLIVNGWPEGRAMMQAAMATQSAITKPARIPALWNDVAGAYPDVQAAIAGDPLNMVNTGNSDKTQHPIIDFLFNISAGSSVDSDSIMSRGAAILSWVDALEDAGYRTSLTLVEYCAATVDNFLMTIQVKRPEDPLDIDRVAYVMAHPSMLRRHNFAAMERLPAYMHKPTYGTPKDLTPEQVPPGAVYFPRIITGQTPQQAAEDARKIIAAGGLIDDET